MAVTERFGQVLPSIRKLSLRHDADCPRSDVGAAAMMSTAAPSFPKLPTATANQLVGGASVLSERTRKRSQSNQQAQNAALEPLQQAQ